MGLWECKIAFKSPQNMMNYNMLFEIASFPSSYREVMESFLSSHLLLSRRGIAGSQGVCLYSLTLSETDGTIVDSVTARWRGLW